MQKKFKELRMFILCLAIFFIFFIATLYYFINKEMMRAIAMIIFTFMALTLCIGRYNLILFDDSMILYEWKILAMLPVLVNYSDIQSITQKSKHHAVVEHKKKTHVYVLNAERFIKSYEELKK